jgi:glycosyltransferase involved in cell wall biosynthesis
VPDTRLRVTIVVDSPVFGGAERYVASLLGALPPDVEPTLLVAAPAAERLLTAARTAGVEVAEFTVPTGKFDVRRLWRLARALSRTRPAVVHVNMATVTNNRHVLACCVLQRLPAVGFLHLWSPVTSSRQRRLLALQLRRVPLMVAASPPIAGRLTAELGYPPQRVQIMRHGVIDPGPPPARGPGPAHVVAVGRLVPEKGYDVLLRSVAELMAAEVPLRVTVAGDGPERDRLVAGSAGLPVTWLGEVPDPTPLLRDGDIFCLPSRNEAIGFALLEAMAAGLPCVASALGQIPALAPDVRVVPPEDVEALTAALRELALNPEERRALGAAARSRVLREHSIAAMAEVAVSAYRTAAAAQRRAGS